MQYFILLDFSCSYKHKSIKIQIQIFSVLLCGFLHTTMWYANYISDTSDQADKTSEKYFLLLQNNKHILISSYYICSSVSRKPRYSKNHRAVYVVLYSDKTRHIK